MRIECPLVEARRLYDEARDSLYARDNGLAVKRLHRARATLEGCSSEDDRVLLAAVELALARAYADRSEGSRSYRHAMDALGVLGELGRGADGHTSPAFVEALVLGAGAQRRAGDQSAACSMYADALRLGRTAAVPAAITIRALVGSAEALRELGETSASLDALKQAYGLSVAHPEALGPKARLRLELRVLMACARSGDFGWMLTHGKEIFDRHGRRARIDDSGWYDTHRVVVAIGGTRDERAEDALLRRLERLTHLYEVVDAEPLCRISFGEHAEDRDGDSVGETEHAGHRDDRASAEAGDHFGQGQLRLVFDALDRLEQYRSWARAVDHRTIGAADVIRLEEMFDLARRQLSAGELHTWSLYASEPFHWVGEWTTVIRMAESVVAVAAERIDEEPGTWVSAMSSYSHVLCWCGLSVKGVAVARAVVDRWRAEPEDEWGHRLSYALRDLGHTLQHAGLHTEAIDVYREHEELERTTSSSSPWRADLPVGRAYLQIGRPDLAERRLRGGLDRRLRNDREDDPMVDTYRIELARALHRQGEYEAAATAFDAVRPRRTPLVPPGDVGHAYSIWFDELERATTAVELGRYDVAEEAMTRLLDDAGRMFRADSTWVAPVHTEYAALLLRLGRADEAFEHARLGFRIERRGRLGPHKRMFRARGVLREVAAVRGGRRPVSWRADATRRISEADPCAEEAAAAAREKHASAKRRVSQAYRLLGALDPTGGVNSALGGVCLLGAEQHAEAGEWSDVHRYAVRGMTAYSDLPTAESARSYLECLRFAARALVELQEPDAAERLFHEAARLFDEAGVMSLCEVDAISRVDTLHALAEASRAAGHLEQALRSMKAAHELRMCYHSDLSEKAHLRLDETLLTLYAECDDLPGLEEAGFESLGRMAARVMQGHCEVFRSLQFTSGLIDELSEHRLTERLTNWLEDLCARYDEAVDAGRLTPLS